MALVTGTARSALTRHRAARRGETTAVQARRGTPRREKVARRREVRTETEHKTSHVSGHSETRGRGERRDAAQRRAGGTVRSPVPRGVHSGRNRTTVVSKPIVLCPCACSVCPGGVRYCVPALAQGRTCCLCSVALLSRGTKTRSANRGHAESARCSVSNPPCAPQGKQGHSSLPLQLQ